jgi:lysozyme family protein
MPSIPRIFSRAIHDRVKMEVFEALKVRDKSLRTDYLDSQIDYYGNGRTIKGSKLEAENLLKKMSAWERKSYYDYLQSPSYR